MKVPALHTVTPASNLAEGHAPDTCMHGKVSLLPTMQNPSELSELGSVGKQGMNLKKCLSYSEYIWARTSPTLWFGLCRMDKKHWEVT